MGCRWLLPILLGYCTTGVAQLGGHFWLEKSTFAPGEPVYLYYEVRNDSPILIRVSHGDPYSFCSGFQISLSTDPDSNSSCYSPGAGGSCLTTELRLAPGERKTERILLNFRHNLKESDTYEVKATRVVEYSDSDRAPYLPGGLTLETAESLHFSIDKGSHPSQALWRGLIDQLKSPDYAAQIEAARTLASLAPPEAEKVLLTFADNSTFKQFAPLALSRLNTSESMAKLAELLVKSERGSYEQFESARYLAESGDRKWAPILLELARANPSMGNYLEYAAENAGDDSVPLLLELIRSPDKEFTPSSAMSALGYTGSRRAVPILLDLLRNPDPDISGRALYGLRLLTHMSYGGSHWAENPQSQYSRWNQWWSREGTTAVVYKATECGEFQPLP